MINLDSIIKLAPIVPFVFMIVTVVLNAFSTTKFEMLMLEKSNYKVKELIKKITIGVGVYLFMVLWSYYFLQIVDSMLLLSMNTIRFISKMNMVLVILLLCVFTINLFIEIKENILRILLIIVNSIGLVTPKFIMIERLKVLGYKEMGLQKSFKYVLFDSAISMIILCGLFGFSLFILNRKKSKEHFIFKGKKSVDSDSNLYLMAGIHSNQMILLDKPEYKDSKKIYIYNNQDDTYSEFEKVEITDTQNTVENENTEQNQE